jgi:hypothetical protein
MTDKRTPTLADRFIASRGQNAKSYLQQPYVDDLIRKTRAAHKFVLDEDAATQVAHVVRDIPDLLVRQHDFARPPFDLTWIEFPHWKFWREVGNDPAGQDGTADHTLGYLIDGNVATVIAGGTVDHPHLEPMPGVFQYFLNSEWPHGAYEEFLKEGSIVSETLDAYLWGTTATRLSQDDLTKLRARYCAGLAPILYSEKSEKYRRLLNYAFGGSSGELRNIVALLLMLNRPTVTRYSNAPAGRGWYRGKVTPFLAHTSVTIDFNAVETMRVMGTPAGDAVPRRRHEVRGHYCQNRTARSYARMGGCMHDWQPCGDDWTPIDAAVADADRWVCRVCEGKRWWRAEHERGDASIGFRNHPDYRVVAS